jgi:Uma2 family endonuclease
MATATRIALGEYLKSHFEPDAEFVHGEIEERSVGEYEHNLVQWAILDWFRRHDKQWHTRSIQEQRTLLGPEKVRILDVSVWPREVPVQPVFSTPQLIAIEVLSPEDRHSKVQEKIDDYRRFSIPHIWIVDPVERAGWNCSDGNWTRTSNFAINGSPIHLDLGQLFRDLDLSEA